MLIHEIYSYKDHKRDKTDPNPSRLGKRCYMNLNIK
jgi:hypothetical protein